MKKIVIGLAAIFGVFSIGNAAQIISPIIKDDEKVGYVVKPNPNKEFYIGKCLTAENDTVGTYKSLHKAVKELKEVCEVNSK
jgi:hypothetical protein